MKTIFALALAAVIGWVGLAPETAQAQDNYKPKVVYHLDDAFGNGLKALRNMRNHLNTAPETDIVLVMHSGGVDLMFEGATHGQSETAYGPLIADLRSKGVRFLVCEITLQRRNLSKDQFILETEYTPSGVVALTDLQLKDGRAYIKP
jgi:uncharacterized protein